MMTDYNCIFDTENIQIMFKDDWFKHLKSTIEKNGFTSFKIIEETEQIKINLYSPQIAYIITSEVISAYNPKSRKEELFLTSRIRGLFIEGYKKGCSEFNDQFDNPIGLADKETARRLFERLKVYLKNTPSLELIRSKEYFHIGLHSPNMEALGFATGVYNSKEKYIEKYSFEFSEYEKNQPQPKRNDFDSNEFNAYTYDLFTYLLENYKKKGKIKYINIWYFLKRDCKPESKSILFNFTQEKFKEYCKGNLGIQIKKFEKSEFKYKETELGILNDLVDRFNKNEHKKSS